MNELVENIVGIPLLVLGAIIGILCIRFNCIWCLYEKQYEIKNTNVGLIS